MITRDDEDGPLDQTRFRMLLAECEQRLATITEARADTLKQPIRRPSVLLFLERERAVYAFGVFLLKELRHPSETWRQQFP
jgi:hypothetical protein